MNSESWRSSKKLSLKKLTAITLKTGEHRNRSNGLCAMEAAAWLAGEEHSDQPRCVNPAIATFMHQWNDALPTDADRDRLLRPLLPKILGTAGDSERERRVGYLALDWLIREYAPAFLDLAGHKTEAKALRDFQRIVTEKDVIAVQPLLAEADEVASAAESAAWSAAGSALAPTGAKLQDSAVALVVRMAGAK